MSYRFDLARPLGAEVRRVALEEIVGAVACLEAGRDRRDGGAHDARKRLKRLRGLLRLVAAAAPDFRRAEESRIRDVARSLSAARDATAIVETVDRLAREAETPSDLDKLMTIRRGLLARRDRIVKKQADQGGAVRMAVAELGASAVAFGGLALPEDPADAAKAVAAGAERTYRRALKALRKAAKGGRDDDFHELRKNVKYHEMHMRLLRDAWPGPAGPDLALAGELGEKLGHLHDIPVLHDTIETERIAGSVERKLARHMMRRKRNALAEQCLEEAAHLLSLAPDELGRALAARCAAAEVATAA
jgi:CHAD domain-containing protein